MKHCRAKFTCTHVIQAVDNYPSKAYLHPVYAEHDGSENEENKSFSDATPSGALEICISEGTKAVDFFKPGRDYYLDFTRIQKEPTKE